MEILEKKTSKLLSNQSLFFRIFYEYLKLSLICITAVDVVIVTFFVYKKMLTLKSIMVILYLE